MTMPAFVTDLLANFWVALVLKLLLVALLIPLIGMVIGFAEMKLSAKMQARVGPYFAGGRWGWAQLIADGVKFFQKEDLIPRDADRPVFKYAPAVVMVGTVALFVVIPWGPGIIFRDLSVGIFYASGVLMGGSAIAILLRDLLRTLFVPLSENELVMVQESEELAALQHRAEDASAPPPSAGPRR